MVDGTGAEFAVELFGSQSAEIVDVVGPQVEDVISTEPVPLFHHNHFGPQELGLYGRSEAAGAAADH